MRLIVIGGSGTIGTAVCEELSRRHEVLVASRHGDLKCDIGSEESIRNMFKKAGKVDAVVVTAGNVHFEEFEIMTSEKYHVGLNHKLMGQVNVVLIGIPFVKDKGSFTLTSGTLSHDPVRTGSSASMVNSAIDGFVRGASIEMPRGIRLNAVSPTILTESLKDYGSLFHGFEPVPASKVALAYSKSVEGLQSGQVYSVV